MFDVDNRLTILFLDLFLLAFRFLLLTPVLGTLPFLADVFLLFTFLCFPGQVTKQRGGKHFIIRSNFFSFFTHHLFMQVLLSKIIPSYMSLLTSLAFTARCQTRC